MRTALGLWFLACVVVHGTRRCPAESLRRASAGDWRGRQLRQFRLIGPDGLVGAVVAPSGGGAPSELAAATRSNTATSSGAWGSPDTWSAGVPPSQGAAVIIPAGLTVTLDQDVEAALDTLTVEGRLECGVGSPRISLLLSVLRVTGEGAVVSCGTVAAPFRGHLTVTLNGPTTPDDERRAVIVQRGGVLALHGLPKRPWSRLAEGAPALQGARFITVAGPLPGWQVGDAIALAPTDYSPDQAEENVITSISQAGGGSVRLELAAPLSYNHNGEVHTLPHLGNGRNYTLDARAEVAVLSRNIVIQGDDSSDSTLQGGDLRANFSGVLQLSHVELFRMGKLNQLGRYPYHLHGLGSAGAASSAIGVSVHRSFQRCIVVHCTDNVQLVNNTCYNTVGFAFMLEDGGEVNTTLSGNLAILTRKGSGALVEMEGKVGAAYWWFHPSNTFLNNVAAGTQGPGFMFDLGRSSGARILTLDTCPDRLPGLVGETGGRPTHPRTVAAALARERAGEFRGNAVHSSFTGLWFDGDADNPMGTTDGSVKELLDTQVYNINVTLTLNHEGCLHSSSLYNLRVRGMVCANSRVAEWHARGNTLLEDWLIANVSVVAGDPGNPPSWRQRKTNAGLAGVQAYTQAGYLSRVHTLGYTSDVETATLLQVISSGDQDAPKFLLGSATSDLPAGGRPLPVLLMPGNAICLRDVAGSVGPPGSLLVPIAPCIDPDERTPTTVLNDPLACPRRLDPIVADAVAADPQTRCELVRDAPLFACPGLRLVGLYLATSAPSLPRTFDALELLLYNARGELLRPLRGPGEAGVNVVALRPFGTYSLSGAALGAMDALTLRLGASEARYDFLRLTFLGVGRPPRRVSTPGTVPDPLPALLEAAPGSAGDVRSVAAVDDCATPFCYAYDNGSLHVLLRPSRRAAPGLLSLDGGPSGLLAPLAFAFVFEF